MRIWLLGIPLDTFTDQAAESKALFYAEQYQKDGTPKYVSAVNVNLLALSWSYFGIKNREFLTCLRSADVSVASSQPLVILSALLGNPLPKRITRQELFPELVETFTLAKKSIFLLGGSPDILQKCEIELLSHYPSANIVGALAPAIHIEGSKIRDSFERDRIILDTIHKAKPDLLFIQLGAPKQELWFHRVKEELKVPLSMGLGGTFEKFTFKERRVPSWMSNFGLEWAWNLTKDPIRFFSEVFKLIGLATPLVVSYKLNEWLEYYRHIKDCPDLCQRPSLLFLSPHKTVSVIRLPCLLDQDRANNLKADIDSHLEHDVIIVDFKKLRHVDLYGCEYLADLWQRIKQRGKGLYSLNYRPGVKRILKYNKLWDLMKQSEMASPKEALDCMQDENCLFMAVEQDWGGVRLYFFGALSSSPDYEKLLEQIFPVIESKALTVDLSYLSFIESRGQWFLIKIKEHQIASKLPFKIVNYKSE